MAGSTVTFKCPNCDAGLLFNAEKQVFSCEFCLSDFSEAELLDKRGEEPTQDEPVDGEFTEGVDEYNCPSCGAQIIADKSTVADFCYYCHNPIVLAGKVSGFMRPSKIIPFKFDKEQAKDAFLSYARKKKFLPKDYFAPEQADKITGIYYPFWVTDADTVGNLETTANKVRTWRMGDYRYTEVSTFDVKRRGEIHFEDITNLALAGEDEEMLEGILPYPIDSYIDFEMPYLHGYYAKKRDIERESLNSEVRETMHKYAAQMLHGTIQGYSSVDNGVLGLDVRKAHWEYALLPIWILTYKRKRGRKEKVYTYAMNGCTGKIYGELPVSLWKILSLFASVAIGVATICGLIGGFLL